MTVFASVNIGLTRDLYADEVRVARYSMGY